MKEYILKDIKKKKITDFDIDYQRELNKSQLEVVEQLKGPVLVIAGAGSGKTRTLVYRMARLVEEGNNPENILLLTFTRKAAHEMLRRASALTDERCGKVSGGTFHSFSNMILRKYAKLIDFDNNFTILDGKDSEDIIGLIRTKLNYHRSENRFPGKATISEVISKSINKDFSVEKILRENYPHFIDSADSIRIIAMEYEKFKKSKYIMDYDDLLIYLEILLRENEDIRKRLSDFYQYIMIDEYQDTNKLQAKIAYLLASSHRNIMAVGDDSQSIYSFRGANFRNIMDFPKIYQDARVIKLEQNYRSTQPILDFTNEIIRYAGEKYSKVLFTKKKGDQKPVYIETQGENYQSKFIVQRILELREEGVELNDIAVLFRTSWHSMDLELELMGHNIPFVKYGGIKFSEAAHIKDVIAHLKVVYNPNDSVGWHRVLLLIEGIGPQTADNIVSEIVDNKKGIEFLGSSVSDNPKYGCHLKELIDVIKKISGEKLPVAEMVRTIINYYEPLLKDKYDDYNRRMNDLNSLESISFRYKGLEEFLTDITLEPINERQSGVSPEKKDEECLILSTIHSAKGLEWHTVFVIYLIDGYLPSSYCLETLEEIEEERRLLYVAITRARQNLYLIKPESRRIGGNYFESSHQKLSEVSRFLSAGEILEKFTEKWCLKE